LRGGKFVPVVDIDKSCFKQYCIAKSQPSGNSNYPYAVSVLEYMISGLKPAPGQSVIEFSPNSESGNVVLAKVENPATTFIAIDTAAKRVVAMVPPFSTDYDNVNLVPGGKTALYWKDNQLALLDTSNGFVLRTWNEDLTGLRGICGGGVTAITSSGLAVTDSCKADRDVFHATSLGLSSSLQPTQDEVQNRVSWYFFAVQ
jgi:hypothetical protein